MRGVHRLVAAALVVAASPAVAEDIAVTDDPRLEPAEMMELADKRILVGLSRVGDRFLAVGMRGHILASTDGESWTQQPVPVRSMLVTIDFPTEQVGYVGGHDGVVLKTTDGGETWAVKHFDPEPTRPIIVYDLEFADADTGWAVGSYGLMLRTTDGGENWERLEPDVAFLGFHISNLVPLGGDTLLMVGEKGLAARSTDNGETWEMLASPYSGSFFGAVPGEDGSALIYGMRGRLYEIPDVTAVPTQDPMAYDPFTASNVEDPQAIADMGWKRLRQIVTESYFGATEMPDGSVALVGNAGLIVRSDADRDTFTRIANPNGDTLAGVLASDDRLLTVGRQGVEWHPASPQTATRSQ